METNLRSRDLSWELADMLSKEGFASKGTASNLKYRTEVPGWELAMHPDISHRYMAVRSGAGSFGWSGNVGIKGYGTAVILGTTVTTADLEPTAPVPEKEGFCDTCKLCVSACAVGMFEHDRSTTVTIGGVKFTHAARKNYMLCQFCCGGFTGLSKSGRWSTWSPGRFRIPDDPAELLSEFSRSIALYAKRPAMPGGYLHPALGNNPTFMTCGNCQLVCRGDKKETAANLKLLHNSGCVLQGRDGGLFTLPPDEAARAFEKMDPGHKALYI
jgi:ferredoxin